MPVLYHERQQSALCGQHCLNNLLQGPYFTEVDLAQIAQQLDAREAALMMENGVDDETRRFLARGSQNVGDDGNFSVQVLATALQGLELTLEDTRRPEARVAIRKPHFEQGFILHRQAHWYAVRKVDGLWWQINSTQPLPEQMTEAHLSATLAQLVADNWTVFVVRGKLPAPTPPSADALASNWVDTARPAADRLQDGGAGGAPAEPKKPSFVAFTGAGQTLGGGPAAAAAGAAAMSEEQQLAVALALSDELALTQRLERRLPAEPPEGVAAARVLVRMPDGARASRKFAAEATLQSLVDFVLVQLAAGGHSAHHASGRWQLSSQYPALKLAFSSRTACMENSEHEALTFASAGLAPSAQLHLAAA
ncbi:hypothetical protein AB1Y20_023296 [Prymnesium parvum]|uniref:ubiquitinyl hydrolase 1 n=1 Tax=Prymnesium parvum TaxID=97485 RepID=A0AB34JGJ7_PRYPA